MPLAFADRVPTTREIEKLRLVLSTYQDGTGMLNMKGASCTLPGWRDFERSIALAFSGTAQESKALFDVLLHDSEMGVDCGLSCKMRETLRTAERTGRVTIEVSNSAGYFWTRLKQFGFTETNYNSNPSEVGRLITDLVGSWHSVVSIDNGGTVDLSRSYYLVLQWEFKTGRYQLYQYDLRFPDPDRLSWEVRAKRLIGQDGKDVVVEWYGHSGGQLKYYPLCDDALWVSSIFKLEQLPHDYSEYGIKRKAEVYFPERWRWANLE